MHLCQSSGIRALLLGIVETNSPIASQAKQLTINNPAAAIRQRYNNGVIVTCPPSNYGVFCGPNVETLKRIRRDDFLSSTVSVCVDHPRRMNMDKVRVAAGVSERAYTRQCGVTALPVGARIL